MLSLPTEIQLKVLKIATHVPHLLEITASASEPFYPEDNLLDSLIDNLHDSLPTRHALTSLVSRTFNALATSLLYVCLVLNPTSTPRICASLTKINAYLVHHIVLDFSLDSKTFPDRNRDVDLATIFALLPNVHTLSIRAELQWRSRLPGLFLNSSLSRVMAESFGPTLRKLVLHRNALTLFLPAHLSMFTSSLEHLEALIFSIVHIPLEYASDNHRIALPVSLPRLRYLNIAEAPFALPVDITPTHVHHPEINLLPSVLTLSLTHISLRISGTPIFDAYNFLSATCPNLVSLTLSGFLPYVTHVLTDYPLPAVSRLVFADIKISKVTEPATLGRSPAGVMEERLQLWVDAVWVLGAKQPALSVVSVLDEYFMGQLRSWVEDGRGRMSGWEWCEFVMEDRDGRALLDIMQRGVGSSAETGGISA